MVLDNLTAGIISSIDVERLLIGVSSLNTTFQAIGGLIIAYIVFNIISIWQGRKRRKDSERMVKLLEQINKKLDKKR